jgi:hypothetical protein
VEVRVFVSSSEEMFDQSHRHCCKRELPRQGAVQKVPFARGESFSLSSHSIM